MRAKRLMLHHTNRLASMLVCCRMTEMRKEENKAFRTDLEEAASSKAQLSDQLADARAEASSWQHQLTAAEEKLDTLKERFKHERSQKQAIEQDSEVCSCPTTLCNSPRLQLVGTRSIQSKQQS